MLASFLHWMRQPGPPPERAEEHGRQATTMWMQRQGKLDLKKDIEEKQAEIAEAMKEDMEKTAALVNELTELVMQWLQMSKEEEAQTSKGACARCPCESAE